MPTLPPGTQRKSFPKRWDLILCALLAIGITGCPRAEQRVVLYCAQDKEFAEGACAQFKTQTNIPVAARYDTEADKSVSLYEELVREAERPRCDVFWNNEILSTIRLQRRGLLEPYASPSAKPYPPSTQAPDQTWHAFAARARVILVNTKLVPESDWPKSLFDLTDPRWKGKVAMSKPQFGTSATQAACLFEVLGKEEASKWYLGLRDNGVQVVPGNKHVAEGVGEGRFAVGLTDTDDAIEEVKQGHPVAIIFPDRDAPKDQRMGTLFIPNSVALIRGAPHAEAGRKLIDFLLSAEVEKQLAEAESHQIPLNPAVVVKLPSQLEPGRTAKPMAVDWYKAADLWDEVQTFLRNEFGKP